MSETDYRQLLIETGHMPLGIGDALDSHVVTVEAVKSYQEFMAYDFNRLCQKHHGRDGIADGAIGPATVDLFKVPRCGRPDFEGNSFGGTGSGSWPVGCHEEYPDNHCFTINVDKTRMPSYLDDVFEEAFRLCQLAYANIGIAFLRKDGDSRANTKVTWQRGNGWIGLAIVPRGPKCGDTIWARFDNRYRPSQLLDQWARLLAHEFGHNMGMSHTRGGIMNPSIIGGKFDETEWRGDPAERTLTRYFGGEPVKLIDDDRPDPEPEPDPPNPEPDPPTPPNPRGFQVKGELELFQDGKYLGTYTLKPVDRPDFGE